MNFIKKSFCLLLFFIAFLPFEEVKAQTDVGKLEAVKNITGCWYESGNWRPDLGNEKYRKCIDEKRAESVQIQKTAALKFDELQKRKLAGAVTTPMEKLKEAAEGIGAKLVGFATNLFWLLFAITFFFQFSFMLLKRSDMGEFFAEFVKFSITMGFFYWLLVNGSAIGMAIFNGFSTDLSQKVSTFNASPIGIILASADIFSLMADTKSVAVEFPETWFIFLVKVVVGVICIILLAIVAINYAILQATGYLVLLLGVIVLGFGGSPYTRDWALTYFRSAISLGIKLLTMTLVVAVGITALKTMAKEYSEAMALMDSVILLVAVVLLYKVADNVPNIVSSFIGNAGASASGINPTGAAAVAAMAAPIGAALTAGKMVDAAVKGDLKASQIGAASAAFMGAMLSGGKAGQAFRKSIGDSIEKNQKSREETQKAQSEKDTMNKKIDKLDGKNLSASEKAYELQKIQAGYTPPEERNKK